MRRLNPYGPPADARYHYEVPRRELVERCVASSIEEVEGMTVSTVAIGWGAIDG